MTVEVHQSHKQTRDRSWLSLPRLPTCTWWGTKAAPSRRHAVQQQWMCIACPGLPKLSPEHLGFHQLWSDKQQNQPSAQQLCRMLTLFSTYSAFLTLCPLPLPIQKGVKIQGIWNNTLNLSLRALNSMSGTKGRVLGVVEVPEGLRRLKATVREIRMHCFAHTNVPEWLAELENLQLLHLDGEWSREISNGVLIQLPEAWGSLHYLQSLTLMNFESLRTLPSSIVTWTSLDTLHIENCWGFVELPMIAVMTTLQSLTLCDSLQRPPANLGELNLRYLMLGHVKHVDTLPGIGARLTDFARNPQHCRLWYQAGTANFEPDDKSDVACTLQMSAHKVAVMREMIDHDAATVT